MSKLALIKNGKVDNVIIADESWPEEHVVLPEGSTVCSGDLYDGTNFSSAPPPETRYMTKINAQEFMLLLTREEMKVLKNATDPLVQDTYDLFVTRNGEVNTESDIFKEVMAAAVTAGVLTQERADELSLGKPV